MHKAKKPRMQSLFLSVSSVAEKGKREMLYILFSV
jgi:hypothetical protein